MPRVTTPLGDGRQASLDPLLHGLILLTRQFGKILREADIRAAYPLPAGRMSVADCQGAAERLGFQAALIPLKAATLDALVAPFIVLCRDNQPPMLITERQGETFMARALDSGATATSDRQTLLATATTVLLLRPQTELESSPNWRRLVVARFKGIFWELAAASLFINLFTLATPLVMMTIYNKVVGQNALATLDVLAIALLTVYLFDAVLRIIRNYISSHAGARLEALLGSEVTRHLLRLPYRHFETTTSGLIAERLRQLEVIRHFFTGQMPLVLVDLVFVALFLGMLVMMAPPLAGITLAVIPLLVSLSFAFHRRQRELNEQHFSSHAAKVSTLNETLSNALTVKSLGLEPELERHWNHRLGLCAWHGFRATHLTNLLSTVGTTLQSMASLAIIYVGVRLIIHGDLSIGALIAANILASRALAPMRQLISAWHQVQAVRAAFTRLDAILAEPLEEQAGSGTSVPIKGNIRFEQVTFRYQQESPATLNGIDLTIQAGEVIGIIGPSGSGKSTVAKLLQGLYHPTSGRVLIDDSDVRHCPSSLLRRELGVVPQDIQLFAGTVHDNIALGAYDKDPSRVVAAAKFVDAHAFIQRLPQSYDTVLTERGGGLSSGQRQLIAIARALMRNPRVLILDEATSALDPATEERLLKKLCQARQGRTLIMVSHRLAPLALADRIAFIKDGQLERVGPSREMIAQFQQTMAPSNHHPVQPLQEAVA